MAFCLFSRPLFIQITSQKIIHTLENLFIVCIWAYKKFCTRKGKPLGSGLVEASGDFTQKEGSWLPNKPTSRLGGLGRLINRGADCWSLWRKAGDWGFDSSLLEKGFRFGLFFSSWTGRIGCDEQESMAWGLSCSSRQGPGGGLPFGSCSVKYIQAIISIASWEKVKIKAP